MRTGCEAVMTWHRPVRFQKVCPLLRKNEAGQWVCSVRAEEVRPFWLRALGYAGGTVATLLLVTVLMVFAAMRGVGYEVSVRQIAWPPAWGELRLVRAQLFISQARDHYTRGEVREALAALTVARGLDPQNYRVAMMLAQFYQAGNPDAADDMYAQLLRDHPEHRVETARVWFRSLLARGRLQAVAELARRQIQHEPEQASAWVHALIFSARQLNWPEILEELAMEGETPAAVRPILGLAARVLRASPPEARALLVAQRSGALPYEPVYRIDALIRLGNLEEAAQLLGTERAGLSGRDIARLFFAIQARSGNRDRLQREFAALLAPARSPGAGELSLLALHLVGNPDPVLLGMVVEAMERLPQGEVESRLDACFAVFCAAGVQGDRQGMERAKHAISATVDMRMGALNQLELFFLGESAQRHITSLLPQQAALSLELNYALLERYFAR